MEADMSQPTVAELWELVQSQQREVKEQQAVIAELRETIAGLAGGARVGLPARATEQETSEQQGRRGKEGRSRARRLSRSGLLKGAAAGIAGLAAAELAGSMRASPAAADTLATASQFSADDPASTLDKVAFKNVYGYQTGINATGSDIGVFGAAADAGGNATVGYGVHGYNGGPGTAVYGENLGANYGVDGYSSAGTGVHGTGATYGVQGECVNGFGLHGDSTSNTGVGGVGAVYGVWGDSPGYSGGIGVYGTSSLYTGVAGTGGTYGVWGKGDTNIGVYGTSANGLGAVFTGGRAPLQLTPTGTVGAPTTGAHAKGEEMVDANGDPYVCTGSGQPGTWRKLSSVIPMAPVRVMNTRPTKQIGPYKGPIGNNNVLTLTLAGTNGIPSNATGVMGNITAADATGACFLAVVPSGGNHLGVSTINFPAQAQGTGLANAFTVGLSGGKIDIYTGNCGTYTVNIIMDITAFII